MRYLPLALLGYAMCTSAVNVYNPNDFSDIKTLDNVKDVVLYGVHFDHVLLQNTEACIKPSADFEFVECPNHQGLARVGNYVQTPFGQAPYPLGMIDKDGKLLLDNIYHKIHIPESLQAIATDVSPQSFVITTLDLDGLDKLKASDESDTATIIDERMRYALVDTKSRMIVPFGHYDNIIDGHDGVFTVEKDGLYGVIDAHGHEIITPMYDNPVMFYQGFSGLYKNGKYGIINLNNKTVIDFKYNVIYMLKSGSGDMFFNAVMDNTSYLYNSQGEKIFELTYPDEHEIFRDDINTFQGKDFFIIAPDFYKSSGQVGLIDTTGNVILPFEYDGIYPFLTGLTSDLDMDDNPQYIKAIKKDGVYFYDTTGKLIKHTHP